MKGDSIQLPNSRPTVLVNTIYKLFTSTTTSPYCHYVEMNIKFYIVAKEVFNKKYSPLNNYKPSLPPLRTSNLQTNIYIHILYRFKNVFGSIDHARLLAIKEDLRYSLNLVKLVGIIYTNLTTIYTDKYFEKPEPI